jgi:hypothetical protein
MSLANSWLKDCLERHSTCPSGPDHLGGVLPTRVLEIEPDGTHSRLLTTRGSIGRYSALSYSWGAPPHPWKTTLSTLPSQAKSIVTQDLPRTLRDAITITCKLGLRYLWIDALCIIQDSDDWAIEAGKMGDYYRNATVTISADGSVDSHSGCFVRGDRRSSTSVPVLFNNQDAVLHVRAKGAWPLDGSHPPMASKSGISNKLITRGWTLQEYLLSPRILHCTQRELVWECASAMPCECKLLPDKPSPMLLKKRLIRENYLPRPLLQKQQASHDAVVPSGFLLYWGNVVADFTTRDLTYPSDRLPALSGLAVMIQKRDPENAYVAGLWKKRLPVWLCWQTHIPVQGSKTPSNRQATYCAPTWSWASTTGRIVMPTTLENYIWIKQQEFRASIDIKLEVISVVCIPAAPNLLGNLRNGELRCKGIAVPVTLQKTKATQHLYVIADLCVDETRPTALVYRDTYEDNGDIEIGCSYVFLVVLSQLTAHGDPRYPSLTYGMLLKKRQGEGYERVALVVGYPDYEGIGAYFIESWEAVSKIVELTIF